MTDLELLYNEAARRDGGLNQHMAGLLAVFDHGKQFEREAGINRMVDEMLRHVES